MSKEELLENRKKAADRLNERLNNNESLSLELGKKVKLRDLQINELSNEEKIAILRLRDGKRHPFVGFFKKSLRTIVKGASIGSGVAGVVNTILPNLAPTIAAYITATSGMGAAKTGIALLATAATPIVVHHSVILGVGAIAGLAIYLPIKMLSGMTDKFLLQRKNKTIKIDNRIKKLVK